MPATAAGPRCVVADDHPAIIDAVCRFLEDVEDIVLVGRAEDGDRAMLLIEETEPDVAVLDVRMPQRGGIELAAELSARNSKTAVILYTGHPDVAVLREALDVGARGFLLKEAPLDDLARAIHVVAEGGTYVDPTLASVLVRGAGSAKLTSLTPREREVLRRLADGMRNDQIARELSISPQTVAKHIKNLMKKLNADTRTQAVANALRQSLIS